MKSAILSTICASLFLVGCGPRPQNQFAVDEVAYLRPTKIPVLILCTLCYKGDKICYYVIRIINPKNNDFYTRSIEETGLEKL